MSRSNSHACRNALRFLRAALIAALLPVAATAQEGNETKSPPSTQVGQDAVKTELLRQTVPVIGRFVPRQAGQVAARVAGPVDAYHVQVGDRVEAGDTLAVLVSEAFKWERNHRAANVTNARARLETARASLQLLEQELKRLDGLRESPAFSQARYEDKLQETVRAKSEVQEAAASLKSAEAEHKLTEIALRNTVIEAPYAGVIVERHSEAGAYLRVGDPVVSLLDYKNLEIEADVPANRVSGLEEGRVIDANMEDGTGLKARVRAVIPDENPRTRTRRVRFVAMFDGIEKSTAANQSVTLQVPAGEIRDVLTVHKDAILNRGGGYVVVLNKDGKATFTPIRIGEAVGQRFVVLSGLAEGDMVVIRGNERLRPGQPIVGGAGAANGSAS